MDKENAIMIILGIIVIGLIIYTGYLLVDSVNQNNMAITNQTNKTTATINESDPNGTNAEITAADVDYQSYDNSYGASQASSSGSTSSP